MTIFPGRYGQGPNYYQSAGSLSCLVWQVSVTTLTAVQTSSKESHGRPVNIHECISAGHAPHLCLSCSLQVQACSCTATKPSQPFNLPLLAPQNSEETDEIVEQYDSSVCQTTDRRITDTRTRASLIASDSQWHFDITFSWLSLLESP